MKRIVDVNISGVTVGTIVEFIAHAYLNVVPHYYTNNERRSV